MTSIRNPLQDFVLTPQQQNLLFAALNSNRAAASSPANNLLNMSPSTLDGSPALKNDPNGFHQDSPFGDPYDFSFDGADSGLDFSFDDGSQPRMIGDLPGGTDAADSREDSASADNETNDKRSHPDDDDEEEAGSNKRRESTEKIPKKPGRKPLTSEPSSKRKAQNRAAQRAFRERKEKHLKDLETKVEELEKASASANHENELLKAQIDKMTVELNEYKKRVSLPTSIGKTSISPGQATFGNPIFSNINDVNFQFEFPKFGQLPGPSASVNGNSAAARSATTTNSSPIGNSSGGLRSPLERSRDKASPASSSYTSGLDAQTKEDLAKFSGIFNPPLTTNNVSSASRSSMDSHYSMGTNTSSPSASSNSNMGPSSSCGTSPEPFTQSPMGFKPIDTMTTIGEEQPALPTGSQDFGHFANIDINDMNWLTSSTNFQFDPQLFGNYRESQESVLSSKGLDDSFFNDAFDMDFTTPYNVPVPPVVQPKKGGLLDQIDAAKEADADITVTGQQLTCNNIWEKLQSCPKVQSGDFDLDGLCSDLQKKAKCSGSGAVVNENDFKNVMKKYLGKTDQETEACMKKQFLETAKN